jgi:hypothetical protein
MAPIRRQRKTGWMPVSGVMVPWGWAALLLEAVTDAGLLHDVIGEIAIIDLSRDDLVALSIGPDFVRTLSPLRQASIAILLKLPQNISAIAHSASNTASWNLSSGWGPLQP